MKKYHPFKYTLELHQRVKFAAKSARFAYASYA